ncbi:MAG: 6-hydroxymethylpterin diphosphokinase MptE-like protein [Campylobacterota bacterium]|nr:6-hydroxymethylpterin diphosphokinase MptE-like protein [Campylobacterota bacterium]
MLEQLKNNYKNNLEIFKIYIPNIYKLLNESNNTSYSLEINNDDINVSKNGQLIYPKDTKNYFNNLLKTYESNGNSNLLRYKINTVIKDDSKDIFGISLLHTKYLLNITENYKKVFNKLPFGKDEELSQSFIYTGIIYGIGLGYHIMPLINRYKFRNLILADIDIEMLRVSLYTINWYEIIEYFAKDTTKSLSINIKQNSEDNISKLILNKINIQHPLSYYNLGEFISYSDEEINKISFNIKSHIDMMSGTKRGFFDDEKLGLEHTIHNLKENIPILTNNNIKVDKDKFVFIIGNGPSLDNYIKIIKKYRDNVILIASGSALDSLYDYNIIPDIYIAIERTIGMYEMTKNIPKNYINKITLIGMNTLHPRTFSQFKKKFMFLKSKDTGTSFINDEKYKILKHSNPTVTNGALSLTIALGFKNICLFGIDFGYKDKKNHHSKKSTYLDNSSIYSKRVFKDNIEVEGVDGDVIYTQDVYNNSKKYIELLIEESSKDINIYNFSNGAKIDATTRVINPKDIKLDKQKINKIRVLKDIKKQFTIYNKNISINYKIINKKINILENFVQNMIYHL